MFNKHWDGLFKGLAITDLATKLWGLGSMIFSGILTGLAYINKSPTFDLTSVQWVFVFFLFWACSVILGTATIIAFSYARYKWVSGKTGTVTHLEKIRPSGPDWTIGEAWFYLMEESQWSLNNHPSQMAPLKLIDDALSKGSIRSWGEICINWEGEDSAIPVDNNDLQFSGNEVQIEIPEWKNMHIWAGTVIMTRFPRRGSWHMTKRRSSDRKDFDKPFKCYGKIRVNSSEILNIWPPRYPERHGLT